MAKAEPPKTPFAPVNWDTHQQNIAAITEKHRKNRAESVRLLNPEYAARKYRQRYPLFDWEIQAEYPSRNAAGIFEIKKVSATVAAPDEQTAWAMFCDSQGITLGPADCSRTIKKLGMVTGERQANGDES